MIDLTRASLPPSTAKKPWFQLSAAGFTIYLEIRIQTDNDVHACTHPDKSVSSGPPPEPKTIISKAGSLLPTPATPLLLLRILVAVHTENDIRCCPIALCMVLAA